MTKKIMIVEDSNLVISVISNFIKNKREDMGIIIAAHSGEESVEKFKTEKPDLIFMDINMPGMDGITALEEIKKIDSNAKVIMCTSAKEPEQEEKARKAGCVDYIIKPFDRQEIIDAVNKNL